VDFHFQAEGSIVEIVASYRQFIVLETLPEGRGDGSESADAP
jgi:hypothetical protein